MSRQNEQKIKRIVPRLLEWFSTNARPLPWRQTNGPYAIWVSEIMLQQTQVKTVIPYWERWMRALPTIADLAAADSQTLHKLWEGLGYYNRVRNLQKAARLIVSEQSGQFPSDYEAILNLPGVGRYTAGAISSIAFNLPHAILDGNVIRVLTRLFGIAENPREKTTNELLWNIAQELVTAAANTQHATRNTSSCSYLNQSLMALICTPKQPKCTHCPVRKQCEAHRTNRTEQIPNLGPRVAATERRFVAFVIEHQDKYLVRQRPAGQVNAHLWEFPNVEVFTPDFSPAKLAKEHLGMRVKELHEFCTIRHTITRYRITLQAFKASPHSGIRKMRNQNELSTMYWFSPSELDDRPFTSAHRKILNYLAPR
jgi:A/G-specific adenine glycosylase